MTKYYIITAAVSKIGTWKLQFGGFGRPEHQTVTEQEQEIAFHNLFNGGIEYDQETGGFKIKVKGSADSLPIATIQLMLNFLSTEKTTTDLTCKRLSDFHYMWTLVVS